MKTYIQQKLFFIFIILFSFACNPAMASHIVGGEMAYVYMGDTTIGPTLCHKYQVTFNLYADCQNGQPEAIVQDNPAFITVYDGTGHAVEIDTAVYYTSSTYVPNVYTSPCGSISNPALTCLLKRTFIKNYYLPPNATGYIITSQRCCRNAEIVNIADPGDVGSTYFCSIPGDSLINNSAVFKNYPPQVVCLNLPLYYDNSATDADGDSLSYGFCSAIIGADNNNIKPLPLPPPYASVNYIPPYSAQVPFTGSPAIAIDPVTGIMTGKPNLAGRYLVTVRCYEWRSDILIDSITREFEYIVIDCSSDLYKPFVGPDTTIMTGDSVYFNALGGTSYLWSPGTYLSNQSISNPTGYFPVAGNFTYALYEVSDSGCSGTNTRTISVLSHSMFRVPNAFTPNNDGINDYLLPLPVFNCTLLTFKVFNRNGNIVYNGGPNDYGWDGTYQGKKQDMGVYSWEITYIDNEGQSQKAKGNTTLIR